MFQTKHEVRLTFGRASGRCPSNRADPIREAYHRVHDTLRRFAIAHPDALPEDIAGALIKLIPEINREFGLTPQQIEQLSPNKQVVIYKAIVAVGGAMVGKLITRELVIEALKAVGVRLTVKQATKYLPLAGQAISVAIGFAAMQYVGRMHIRECERVVRLVRTAPVPA